MSDPEGGMVLPTPGRVDAELTSVELLGRAPEAG